MSSDKSCDFIYTKIILINISQNPQVNYRFLKEKLGISERYRCYDTIDYVWTSISDNWINIYSGMVASEYHKSNTSTNLHSNRIWLTNKTPTITSRWLIGEI